MISADVVNVAGKVGENQIAHFLLSSNTWKWLAEALEILILFLSLQVFTIYLLACSNIVMTMLMKHLNLVVQSIYGKILTTEYLLPW